MAQVVSRQLGLDTMLVKRVLLNGHDAGVVDMYVCMCACIHMWSGGRGVRTFHSIGYPTPTPSPLRSIRSAGDDAESEIFMQAKKKLELSYGAGTWLSPVCRA